jgi:putative ABC transport system permease protein
LATADQTMFVGLDLDWKVLGFMAGIAVLTCLLFGLAPAIRATRIAPSRAMRAGGRGLTAGRERFSLRRGLVIAQVAMSLVLMVGAFLFVRSLRKILEIQPGFRPEGIISVQVDASQAHFSRERLQTLYSELADRIRERTGASSIARCGWTPVAGSGWDENAWEDGTSNKHDDVFLQQISPRYFKTMQTGFLAGRDFDDRDTPGSPKVAIVNETFAKKIFGGANPIGKVFKVEGEAGKPDRPFQVVGLVRDTKYYELREDFLPITFLAKSQDTDPDQGATFVLRTNAAPAGVFRAATAAIAEVNPGIGVQFSILTKRLQESLLRDRLMAALAGAFGILAGTLAVLGLYGVIAYMVARRRNEIGVRIALGASRGRVVQLVLGEAVVVLAIGLAIGIGLSIWAGRAAATMLYDLKPWDPLTLGAATAVLAAVALLASYAPARRAARLDPMTALREE